jgi:hypothetical protein
MDKMSLGRTTTIMEMSAARNGTEESELVAYLWRDYVTGALSPRGNLTSVPGASTVLLRARNS